MKRKHWRGVTGICACRAAPVLEFVIEDFVNNMSCQERSVHTPLDLSRARSRRAAVRRLSIWGTLLTLIFTGVVAEATTLMAAQSHKVHGTGTFDLPIDLTQGIGGAVTVESRAIGAGHQIVFQFDVPVTFGLPSAVDDSAAPVGVASAVAGNNNSVVVTLTGVPDNQRVRVMLPNVNGVDFSVSLGFLVGDVNSSRGITPFDLQQTKARAGQGVDAENFRFDLNATGVITAADVAAVKGRLGATLSTATTTLNVSKTGSGAGSVTSAPPGIDCGADCSERYAPASLVTLTAVAQAGSAFTTWGGACSGTATGTCIVTLNAAKSVVANFMGGEFLQADASPLRLTAVPDNARTVTQTVPVTGGTITVTGADGTVYTLEVPADALLEETVISMTPTSSLDAPELPQDAAYGVELGPAGATFQNFVTLTIAPPAGASVPIARQLPIGWSGTQNVVSLAAIDPTSATFKLKLLHFSGYALLLATTGMNATLAPVRHRLGGDAEERLGSLAGERLSQERLKQLLGAESDGILVLDDLFRLFDEQVLQPRIAAAGTSCAAGRLALQTVIGFERQKQLLGFAAGSFADTVLPVMVAATGACTREEYALCRDNHIVTRILPYYLGVRRQAELLGVVVEPGPTWLQDAEAAVGKCLNFELQLNSRLTYTNGVFVTAHTVVEAVESRVKLAFNLGVALFGPGYFASSPAGPDLLISRSYDVNYPHACAVVSGVQRVGAGMMGMLGLKPGEGSVVERATVKDFVFTPAVVANGAGSGYTLTRYFVGSSSCETPATTTREYENWVNNGVGTWADAFIDPLLGLAIRNWTIVGSDIMATRSFTTQSSVDGDHAVVTTDLILFHMPAP